MGLAKQLYKNALWYWNGGQALRDEFEAPTLGEDDWEVLDEEDRQEEGTESKDTFTVTPERVPLGLYSLISEATLGKFIVNNKDTLACFWSDKKEGNYHGAIKTFGTNSFPPGWFKLSYLQKVIPNFFLQLGKILYPELARLRTLELEDPYSRRSELQSPLLGGLLVCRSFLHHLFTEICKNPYTDFVIIFPMEILHDMGETTVVFEKNNFVYDWNQCVDMMAPLIAERPLTFPPLVVRLIGPRQTEVINEAAKHRLRQQVIECSQRYMKWIQMAYFQI